MVVHTLEQLWEVALRSTYRRCQFWQKKIGIFYKMRVCKQAKLSHLGHRKPARIHWKAYALKTSHCLLRILVQRHKWAIFLWKWARRGRYNQWKSLSGHVERIFAHKEEDIGNFWFQQNGAMCHTAEATLDVMRTVFEDRIFSRRADVVWPPWSCNVTPMDCYLWGAVKDKCYADKPETIHALKNNIREADIDEIQLHTIDNVLKNWTDCLGYCMTSRSSHLNEIIFHY